VRDDRVDRAGQGSQPAGRRDDDPLWCGPAGELGREAREDRTAHGMVGRVLVTPERIIEPLQRVGRGVAQTGRAGIQRDLGQRSASRPAGVWCGPLGARISYAESNAPRHASTSARDGISPSSAAEAP